jgi:hypothetical protein
LATLLMMRTTLLDGQVMIASWRHARHEKAEEDAVRRGKRSGQAMQTAVNKVTIRRIGWR